MEWVIGIGIFLVLLFVFPRVMTPILILGGLGIGAVVLYFYLESEERARQRALVQASIEHNSSRCSEEYPLLITWSNNSGDTVKKIWFKVKGFRKGYSDPIYSGFSYESDRIITAGQSWSNCWRIPGPRYDVPESRAALHPPETLIWQVEDITPIYFER
jgi:hypothetical protein